MRGPRKNLDEGKLDKGFQQDEYHFFRKLHQPYIAVKVTFDDGFNDLIGADAFGYISEYFRAGLNPRTFFE